MIRGRGDKPFGDPLANRRGRQAKLANGAKESGNMLIENLLGCRRDLRVVAHMYAAAAAMLRPAFPLQLAIARAYGICMDAKAAGEFAGAWKTVPGAKIVAENR